MASIKKEDIINCIKYCQDNNIFDDLNKVYSSLPTGYCTGCGDCCMESVGINLVEFINIFNYLKDRKNLKKQSLEKIIDYYFLEYKKKSPCPFKDTDNRCLIYEVRPLNCRLFGHWKKEDYNKNLDSITKRNIEYKNMMKKEYNFEISDDVVNYRINFCDDFIPNDGYVSKSKRMEFYDRLIILDSKIYSFYNIEFRDRGLVEYFIEYLLDNNLAYNIKIKISQNDELKERVLRRIKNITLLSI